MIASLEVPISQSFSFFARYSGVHCVLRVVNSDSLACSNVVSGLFFGSGFLFWVNMIQLLGN